MIGSEKNSVLLVGYARDDSPARKLLDAPPYDGSEAFEVELDRMVGPQPLRAHVERFRFSGHAHRRDILGLVDRMKPRHVILLHGESRAREWMKDNIEFFHPDVVVTSPQLGEEIPLFVPDEG
jgi:Cft2 family RNA processing exonuclease